MRLQFILKCSNGRKEPFKLKYVEIGNENNGPDYQKRYRIFYDAIKAKYPDIITIANEHIEDAELEVVDEHYYVGPNGFFEKSDFYDKTDRDGPAIYVGEYSVIAGVGGGNLLGAVAEAVFLLNMESNADIVTMCSTAPLFENVNNRNWPVNLIWMDSSRVIGRSSYQVQKLFGTHRPDVVLRTEVEAETVALNHVQIGRHWGPPSAGNDDAEEPKFAQVKQLYASSGLDEESHELVIKVVNPTTESVDAKLVLKGLKNIGKEARVIRMGDRDFTSENSLDQPDAVVPEESVMTIKGKTFEAEFGPNSVTVLRLPAKG